MNSVEHLLTCLAEECSEVQKEISKSLRFGLDDSYPGTNTTNVENIVNECIDMIAVIELLEEQGVIKKVNIDYRDKCIRLKKEKVLKYMEYARNKGTLI
jgi:dihydroorotase